MGNIKVVLLRVKFTLDCLRDRRHALLLHPAELDAQILARQEDLPQLQSQVVGRPIGTIGTEESEFHYSTWNGGRYRLTQF
jgi:hypothetical protein